MKEGDLVLASFPQANGQIKVRPALALRRTLPFHDWLICGVSTQLRQEVPGFDERLEVTDPEFIQSGLKAASIIRLGFLTVVPEVGLSKAIGSISAARHTLLLMRLSYFLKP